MNKKTNKFNSLGEPCTHFCYSEATSPRISIPQGYPVSIENPSTLVWRKLFPFFKMKKAAARILSYSSFYINIGDCHKRCHEHCHEKVILAKYASLKEELRIVSSVVTSVVTNY